MLNLSTCLSCIHHFLTFLPPNAASSCTMHPKEVHAKPVNLSVLYSSLCDFFAPKCSIQMCDASEGSTCYCIHHFVTFLPTSAASSCAMHEENIEKHVPNSCILFCFVHNFMAFLPLGPASSYAVHLEEHQEAHAKPGYQLLGGFLVQNFMSFWHPGPASSYAMHPGEH